MREVFKDADNWIRETHDGKILQCPFQKEKSCSALCAAFQHEQPVDKAPEHFSCGLMRDNAWIGELKTSAEEESVTFKEYRCLRCESADILVSGEHHICRRCGSTVTIGLE